MIWAFYTLGTQYQFWVQKWEADLELQAEIRDDPNRMRRARLYVPNTFRKSARTFLTITSGVHGTAVYNDGVLTKTAPQFRLSTTEFTGRLVLGDSPAQSDNWSGQMLGVAIYGRELTTAQVLRHYQNWIQA